MPEANTLGLFPGNGGKELSAGVEPGIIASAHSSTIRLGFPPTVSFHVKRIK